MPRPLPTLNGLETVSNVSAYEDALVVDAGTDDGRLTLAAEMLDDGGGVVVLEGIVALRATDHELLCEVVDPMPSARRCANEYEVLVENAQRLLEASTLRDRLPDLPRRWLVVEDRGTGTVETWRAPLQPAPGGRR